MTYKELKEIIDNRISIPFKTLPIDSLGIATKLNLRTKNNVEAKQDFDNMNFLGKRNACCALYKGEYTIYYDENYRYKNFAIAHEIAHYLLNHTTDGAEQHQDAQLMAAMIIAPIELIHKYKIKSALDLSEICKIPINTAEEYWFIICNNKYNTKTKWLSLLFLIIIMSFACLVNSRNNDFTNFVEPPVHSTAVPIIVSKDINIPTNTISPTNKTGAVYVTPYGKKYHMSSCGHIKNSKDLMEFSSASDAEDDGYLPCKDCIKK